MQGAECRVQGAGCRVQGAGCTSLARADGAAVRRTRRGSHLFGVQGSGFRVQVSGFRFQVSGCRVQGPGFKVQGSGFRVQEGVGFKAGFDPVGRIERIEARVAPYPKPYTLNHEL